MMVDRSWQRNAATVAASTQSVKDTPTMVAVIDEPGLKVPIKTWLPPGEIETGAMEQL